MDCSRIGELLLYIDAQLDKEQMGEVYAHIQTCSQCSQEYERHIYIKNQLLAIPELDLPQGFHERLCVRLNEFNRPRFVRNKASFKLFSGLTAATVIFIAFGLFNKGLLPITKDDLNDSVTPRDMATQEYQAENEEYAINTDDTNKESYDMDEGSSSIFFESSDARNSETDKTIEFENKKVDSLSFKTILIYFSLPIIITVIVVCFYIGKRKSD